MASVVYEARCDIHFLCSVLMVTCEDTYMLQINNWEKTVPLPRSV